MRVTLYDAISSLPFAICYPPLFRQFPFIFSTKTITYVPVGRIVCFPRKMPSTEYIRAAVYTRLKTAFNIERDSALIVIARLEVRNASDKTYLILFPLNRAAAICSETLA